MVKFIPVIDNQDKWKQFFTNSIKRPNQGKHLTPLHLDTQLIPTTTQAVKKSKAKIKIKHKRSKGNNLNKGKQYRTQKSKLNREKPSAQSPKPLTIFQ